MSLLPLSRPSALVLDCKMLLALPLSLVVLVLPGLVLLLLLAQGMVGVMLGFVTSSRRGLDGLYSIVTKGTFRSASSFLSRSM